MYGKIFKKIMINVLSLLCVKTTSNFFYPAHISGIVYSAPPHQELGISLGKGPKEGEGGGWG
jgi:hypothetical protein